MTTHEVSEKYQISLAKLRKFECAGLFSSVLKNGEEYIYSADDINRLSEILTLYKIGMKISSIKKYLDLKYQNKGDIEELKQMLNIERLKNLNQCHKRQENISTIDFLIYELEK